MTEPRPARDPVRSFFGYLLVAVGGLMTALCGLCTLVFFVGGLVPGGDRGFSGMALVLGGIPTAIGLGLFLAGRTLLRGPRPPPSDLPQA